MGGVTLNILIEAALLERPYHQQRLGLQAQRYCRAISNRFCSDFPEDLHEEVLGQAFTELMMAGSGSLAGRSGLSIFRRAIFAAIRIVRADYAPPGCRTRRAPAGDATQKVAAEDVGRIVDRQTVDRCTIGEPGERHLEFDLLESSAAADAIKQCEDRVDAEWALRRAPPNVAAALRLICFDDAPVSVAANLVGMSRFALHRQTTAFTAMWRSAA